MNGLVWRVTLALALAWLPFAATAATGAARPPLADFVAFDQAYVPALALTGAKRLAPSRQALERAQAAWQELQTRLAGPFANDRNWAADVSRIDAAFASAAAHLAQARSAEAHEALEPVRTILWQVRERHGIVYLMDRLTAFHEPMEAIVGATHSHATLSEAELHEVATLYAHVRPLWSRVTELLPEAGQQGLDAERVRRLQALAAQEDDALAALGAALERNDPEAVLRAGPALKPPLAAAVMLYGDFRGLW